DCRAQEAERPIRQRADARSRPKGSKRQLQTVNGMDRGGQLPDLTRRARSVDASRDVTGEMSAFLFSGTVDFCKPMFRADFAPTFYLACWSRLPSSWPSKTRRPARLRMYWCALSRLRNAQIRFDGQLDDRKLLADALCLRCRQPQR